MFYLYRSNPSPKGFHYERIQSISLFGCRNGIAAKALTTLLPADTDQPCQWHICAQRLAEAAGSPGSEIVIDTDPNNQKGGLPLSSSRSVRPLRIGLDTDAVALRWYNSCPGHLFTPMMAGDAVLTLSLSVVTNSAATGTRERCAGRGGDHTVRPARYPDRLHAYR